MPAYKFFLKTCLMLLLSMAVGCGDDDGVTPPPPSDTTAPGNVADLASASNTASSAGLAWTAPGDDGTVGTAAQYDIRYSTSVIINTNFLSATQARVARSSRLSCTIQLPRYQPVIVCS